MQVYEHMCACVCKCVYVCLYVWMCVYMDMDAYMSVCGCAWCLVCMRFSGKRVADVGACGFLFFEHCERWAFFVEAGYGCPSHHCRVLLGRTSSTSLCLLRGSSEAGVACALVKEHCVRLNAPEIRRIMPHSLLKCFHVGYLIKICHRNMLFPHSSSLIACIYLRSSFLEDLKNTYKTKR